MKNEAYFTGKKIFVLGLAKSGFAVSKLLHQLGATLLVNDKKAFLENEEAKKLKALGINVVCGEHPTNLLDETFHFVVKNPGIPYSNPIVQKAMELNIPVITEVEIASFITEAPMIGITGSNGKTTTTTLIYEMLKAGQKNPLIAGNIGTAACEVAKDATPNHWMVTELSSFQLMGTVQFKPKIGLLLNIFDAHLDYHGTKENYIQAKAKMFANQTKEDFAILNMDDPIVSGFKDQIESTVIPFSVTKSLSTGASIKHEAVYFDDERIIDVKDIVLPGAHNLENILGAICAAKLSGVSNAAIVQVLTTFKGVKHRLEYVYSLNGRKFYNDSKATNILATQKALSAFTQPVVLLAGGLDRGNSFDSLIPYLKGVKALVTYGQTAPKLMDAAKGAGIKTIIHVDNLEQAVPKAYECSNEGDIVLLSPACASWDQFQTFEQRGDMFVEFVHRLK